MRYFIGLLLLIAYATALPIVDENELWISERDTAMQNKDLFQGDILGFDPHDRNVAPRKRKRWPGGVVPYVIEKSVEKYKDLIREAMDEYEKKTCIRFVERTDEKDYLNIYSGEGCFSYVGYIRKGGQPVSLQVPGCMFLGAIIHELGHALGFFHEQNRSDRDDYLIIHRENIEQGAEDQFFKLEPHQNLLLTPFDYHSIMIYGNAAFSKDGISKTMEAKDGTPLFEPRTKKELTSSDIERLKTMYCDA